MTESSNCERVKYKSWTPLSIGKTMTAKYLIRFDDICPTMNWDIWNQLEAVLIENDIKPIVAVIPDNQDKSFFINEPVSDFWARVKKWQENGWTIGLHGYQHQYLTKKSGLLCLNKQSEFAGMDEKVQYSKLINALKIFQENNITPDIWIAPSHSFDLQTLKVLKKLGLNSISDGFSFRPFRHHNMLWVPQQIWKFRFFPLGVWTVCFHHNPWQQKNLNQFIEDIKKYKYHLTSFKEVKSTSVIQERKSIDMIFHYVYCGIMKAKKRLKASL
jgi:predicted deacetylase